MKEFTTAEVSDIRAAMYQDTEEGGVVYVGGDTFVIPSHELPNVVKKFNKMARKAKELSVAEPTFEVIGIWNEEIVVNVPGMTAEKVKSIRKWSVIKATGEAPKLAGYEFVATLDHTIFSSNVVVRTVPGKSIPNHYYAEGNLSHCEHCDKIRRRNETFVVFNTEEQSHMKVGRQCLKDFLGGNSPAAILRMMQYWSELASMGMPSDDDGWGGGSSYVPTTFDLADYMGRVAAVIRHEGWLPRSKANVDDGDIATADIAMYLMEPPFVSGRNAAQILQEWKDARTKYTPTEQDLETVEAAIDWAKSQESTSEYIHNVMAIASEGTVVPKTIGVAASIIPAYNRATESDTNRQALLKKNNAHFGTVKKREECVVKVTGKTSYESMYGYGTRVTMFEEQTGGMLVWFANGSTSNIVEGDVVRVKLTVKSHGEFNEMKQTVVTRVAYIEHTELTN